jgi:hypothetical protein
VDGPHASGIYRARGRLREGRKEEVMSVSPNTFPIELKKYLFWGTSHPDSSLRVQGDHVRSYIFP